MRHERAGRAVRIAAEAHERSRVLPVVLAAAAGFVAGWLAAPRLRGDEAADARERAWSDRVGEGVEAALVGIREMTTRLVAVEPPSPDELEARLAVVDGASGIEVVDLGEGIVELVGRATERAAGEAAAAVARVPGVHAVVNRVWTPVSAHPASN